MPPTAPLPSDSTARGRRLALAVLGAWTLVLALSFAWNAWTESRRAGQMALLQAQALVDKDVMYRRWNASMGGVWADVSRASPNPHLAAMVAERDRKTADGATLTLINPAYMTRLVFDIQKGERDIAAKITSLNPINPDNAPDAWETGALRQAESGRLEVHEAILQEGRPRLRYLRALVTEPACLACHHLQHYKVGDIRGGISVSVPLAPFQAASAANLRTLGLSHAGVWLVGLLGIALGYRQWRRAELSRQENQAALDQSRAHFRAVVDCALDSIITMDHEGRVIEFNPMAEQVFGYRRDEAIGAELGQLIVPENLRAAHAAGFRRYLQSRQARVLNQRLELTAQRRDGAVFPVELTITESSDGAGHPFFTGYLRDISERKRAEAALLEAKEAAETANRAKSEFLANMSHEIRTPMNGVIGMTGLLLDTPLDAEQREYAETIKNSGESLLSLINDILDFSKIEAGKLDMENIDFDLHALLDDFAAMLALRAHDKGLEFLCAAAPDLPGRLHGDPGRLRQILANLTGNAIKFTERGEVAVEAAPVQVTPESALIRFSVRDSGIGIAANKQGLLFQKFSQVDASTTRKFGGTGLGLAISKRLAAMMGGEIGVHSEAGRGSEFWFTARFQRQAGDAAAPAPASLRGARVLLVDDNATNRRLLEARLASWGVETASAADGPAALDALEQAARNGRPWQVAILDMQMPDMDGAELGRRIRAHPQLRDTRLLMMTSLGQRGDARRFEDIGFAAYLTKPVRQGDLADALGVVLGQPPETLVTRHSLREMREARPPTHSARILLAEDNAINQRVALGLLKKLGYAADAAANGQEALRALRDLPYDLVLMDVQMPEMDGLEASRRIRAGEDGVRNPHIPIIAMTANAMQGDQQACLDAGMDDYLSKPVAAGALAEMLEKWLRAEG